MVLLTVRMHGPVTQIVAIYHAHGRSATQWLITVRLTSVGLMFLTTTKVLDEGAGLDLVLALVLRLLVLELWS